MKKVLFIAAWISENHGPMIHQVHLDQALISQMERDELKRVVIADYFNIEPKQVRKHLLENTILREAIVAKPEHYVVHVEGEVHPVLIGPFDTEVCRDQAAGSVRIDNEEDGLYALNCIRGSVSVSNYSGMQMEELVIEATQRRAILTGGPLVEASLKKCPPQRKVDVEPLIKLVLYVKRDFENNAPNWSASDVLEYREAIEALRSIGIQQDELEGETGRTTETNSSNEANESTDQDSSFDSVEDAMKWITAQSDVEKALLKIIAANVAMGECGFAADILKEYGNT